MRDQKGKNHDIQSFQAYLNQLYSENNKGVTQEYMYGYICRGVGYLCKAANTKQQTVEDFIRPISWLFALASKLEIKLVDAFIGRYPEVCPLCVGHPCTCRQTNKQPQSYKPAYEVEEELFWMKNEIINTQLTRPGSLSLQYAVKTINSIYPNNAVIWDYAGGWYQFSKLQEEVAELHEALGAYTKKRKPIAVVKTELADVMAWILSLWAVTMPDKNIDKEFIGYYILGCPVCGNNPCTCSAYNSRPHGHVDMNSIIELRDNIKILAEELPKNKVALEEVIRSLTAAAESNNDSMARLSVKQTSGKLRALTEGIGSVDDLGKKTFSIVETVIKLIDKISS